MWRILGGLEGARFLCENSLLWVTVWFKNRLRDWAEHLRGVCRDPDGGSPVFGTQHESERLPQDPQQRATGRHRLWSVPMRSAHSPTLDTVDGAPGRTRPLLATTGGRVADSALCPDNLPQGFSGYLRRVSIRDRRWWGCNFWA
jgi:hypothetical protein